MDNLLLSFDSWFGAYDGINNYLSSCSTVIYIYVILQVVIYPTYQAGNSEKQTKDRHAQINDSSNTLLNTITNVILSFDSWFGAYDGIVNYLYTYNILQYACNFTGSDLPHL